MISNWKVEDNKVILTSNYDSIRLTQSYKIVGLKFVGNDALLFSNSKVIKLLNFNIKNIEFNKSNIELLIVGSETFIKDITPSDYIKVIGNYNIETNEARLVLDNTESVNEFNRAIKDVKENK